MTVSAFAAQYRVFQKLTVGQVGFWFALVVRRNGALEKNSFTAPFPSSCIVHGRRCAGFRWHGALAQQQLRGIAATASAGCNHLPTGYMIYVDPQYGHVPGHPNRRQDQVEVGCDTNEESGLIAG